jgi:hypothetical protein
MISRIDDRSHEFSIDRSHIVVVDVVEVESFEYLLTLGDTYNKLPIAI